MSTNTESSPWLLLTEQRNFGRKNLFLVGKKIRSGIAVGVAPTEQREFYTCSLPTDMLPLPGQGDAFEETIR